MYSPYIPIFVSALRVLRLTTWTYDAMCLFVSCGRVIVLASLIRGYYCYTHVVGFCCVCAIWYSMRKMADGSAGRCFCFFWPCGEVASNRRCRSLACQRPAQRAPNTSRSVIFSRHATTTRSVESGCSSSLSCTRKASTLQKLADAIHNHFSRISMLFTLSLSGQVPCV